MPDALAPTPLEPTRDPRATLPDLLEALLNRGVVLHLDLIVSVADIPLIGVSLKAAIAGIETMLEYGMMRRWDEETRAWVQRSISRAVPFLEGEELVARMAGGYEQPGFYTTWRPGTLYLTDRRLFVYRREPREMIWEVPLERIRVAESELERSVGGEARKRLRIELDDGVEARLSAAEPERMLGMLREQVERIGHTLAPASERSDRRAGVVREGRVWYHEPRAGGAVWRGGAARLDRVAGFTWKSPLDTRPAVALRPEEIRSVRLEAGASPAGGWILVLDGTRGPVHLAAPDVLSWSEALLELVEARVELAIAGEESHGPDR